MIRVALAVALVGCFSKPRFDGGVADAAIDDSAAVDAPNADAAIVDGAPTAPNIAFVTSMPLAVGSLGGLVAADAYCRNRAIAGGLAANTYIAWVSASGVGGQSAGVRIPVLSQGWVRPDGAPFAGTRAELLAGDILSPLRIDENGNDVGSVIVGTATQASGGTAGADCVGLTGTAESITFGYSDATRRFWTDANGSISCNALIRMYCLGIDHAVPVGPTVPQGRIAFLSGPWTPTGGVSGADGHCQGIAQNRSIPGNFVALLATQSASAASRLSNGLPWVRLDGVELAASATDVMNGSLDVPLNVDATGDYIAYEPVWTGVPFTGGLTSLTTSDASCDDWTSISSFGTTGSPVRTSNEWNYEITGPTACTEARRLYCFQQ